MLLQPLPGAPRPHDRLLHALRRHPYFLGALAIHGAALWLLSQLHTQGQAQARLQSNQAQIQAYTRAAEQHGMRRRVDSLKAMKSLVERIDRAQAESGEPSGAASAPTPGASQPAGQAHSPQELLAQARELRDSIQRVEQAARARKMAEVLKLSPEEALQKVKQQAAEATQRDAATDAAAQNSEQVMQALNRYEQQARDSLQRLQSQNAQAQQGTPIRGDASTGAHAAGALGAGTGTPSATGPQGAAQGGAGSGGEASPGAAGRADGRQTAVRDERRFEGQLQAPAFDASRLRLGAGNSLGAGGAWANRIYVDRWYLIGPFHAGSTTSIDKIYPPEQWVDLDGVYLGKGQRVLRWQYLSSAAYPLMPPDPAEQAIYYGYTEIVSDQARSVVLALGADDDAKLWLNDQLVWASGNQRKAWYTDGGVQSLKQDIHNRNLIEDRLRVPLRKGRNAVLFKLYNNPLDVFFSLVIEPAE